MAKQPALFYRKVYAVVKQIPSGKVTSYGRVAEMIGHTGAARQVGYAMSALKDRQDDPEYNAVPWQRVVGHDGKILIRGGMTGPHHQAELLREEGVMVRRTDAGNLAADMDTHMWEGLLPHEVDRLLAGLDQD